MFPGMPSMPSLHLSTGPAVSQSGGTLTSPFAVGSGASASGSLPPWLWIAVTAVAVALLLRR